MYYYLLPSAGLYGGVKTAFRNLQHLLSAGYEAAAATPGAASPQWFEHSVPVVAREELGSLAGVEDGLIFSYPYDTETVRGIPAGETIFHIQGVDDVEPEGLPTVVEAVRANCDPENGFRLISSGLHAMHCCFQWGVIPWFAPLSVADVFDPGEVRPRPRSVAVMSRKGGEYVELLRREFPGLDLTVIEGRTELEVAKILKETDIFVTTSVHEAIGMPPLEAMRAGCAVVGFPGIGSYEFMHHGETAHVVPNGEREPLAEGLRLLLDNEAYRDHLRGNGMALARRHSPIREKRNFLRGLGLSDPMVTAE